MRCRLNSNCRPTLRSRRTSALFSCCRYPRGRTVSASVVAVALCFSALNGCWNAKPAKETATVVHPYRGQDVELVVPRELHLPTTWEILLHEWEAETGATVRWTEYSANELSSVVQAQKEATSTGGRVILFPLRQLPNLEESLSPIEAAAGLEFDPNDIFRGLRDRVVSRNRSVVAVPIAAPVLLCYYRADLLKSAKLKPPETWEDYLTLVETLDRWAPGLVAVEPLGAADRATLFSARSLAFVKHPENYSFWFNIDTGEPQVSSAGFVEAMQIASRTWKRMPSTINAMSRADCHRAILQGTAALAIACEPIISPPATESVARPRGSEIGVCRLPGSRRVFNGNSDRWENSPGGTVHAPGLCGFADDGLALGVRLPEGKPQHIAAQHLLSTLAGGPFETTWALLPKSPCRESQVGTAANWNEGGLSVEEASHAVDAAALTLRDSQLVADLPIPNADEFRNATSQCVDEILKGEVEPQAALDALRAEFEKLISRRGRDALRAAYRRGLGLPTLD
jgi:multiple sugar transport system substrate-binding protein